MAVISALVLLIQLVVIQGKTEVGPEDALRSNNYAHFDVYANAIAKAHYNPWFCNYFKEPGYKCTGCSTALHCFPGNFALLIQCAGRLPYCSNGYCAATKAERCIEEPNKYKLPATESNKPTETHNDDEIDKPNPAAEDIATSTNAADAKKEARLLL